MPARKQQSLASWVHILWIIGAAVATWIFTGGVFYATTQGYGESIKQLSGVIKEEGVKREAMAKEEATKRDDLRKEYLDQMRQQTTVFGGLGDKLSNLNSDVKAQGVRTDSVVDRLNKLGDDVKQIITQTRPGRK